MKSRLTDNLVLVGRATVRSLVAFFVSLLISGAGVPANAEDQALHLSAAEQAWLNSHPNIRLAIDIDWAPFEFVDKDRRYRGMAADYIALIESRLGIKFEVDKNRSWDEMVEAVKRRDLDAFSLVVETPQRLEYLNFTAPYISFPMVIVTRDTEPFIDGIYDLRTHLVGVVKNYATHDLLIRNHPEIKIITSNTLREGLEAVSSGQIYAFIDNVAAIGQVIRELGLSNLKISGQTDYRFELRMAVRKDWPELIPILQKGLDSISERERDAIYNKWIRVKYQRSLDMRFILLIAAISLLVIAIFFAWNRRLKFEVEQRRAAELEKQRALDEAERANSAKSAFLAAMSHDLRTPLNSIFGFTQLIEGQIFGPIKNDKYLEYIQIIRGSAQHLMDLVEEILDLSRLESEEFRLNIETFDPAAHTEAVVAAFKPIASDKNVTIGFSHSADLPRNIWADKKVFTQIQNNLISNAIREAPEGSEIKVTWTVTSDGNIVYSVRDYGTGFTDNILRRVGQPFIVENPEYAQKSKKGYGLGLYICKRYVEAQGGTFRLSNPADGGALVVAAWPISVIAVSEEDGAESEATA